MLDNFGLGGTPATLGLGGGLFMLFFARSLDGITGGNITTARAYITDIDNLQTAVIAICNIGIGIGYCNIVYINRCFIAPCSFRVILIPDADNL